MRRIVPLAVVAGVIVACAGVSTAQAAALSGIPAAQVSATQAPKLVSKAHWWRHRRCRWRHHHRRCRYW